ncbi:MAG: hypothetical protein JSS14_01400 [Proteobacteria bacterium]|nr:hypothetical protein [Pseudomonadota bacterium]
MADFDWKELVRTVAPGIAATFGTPAAGLGVKILADVLLGKKDATEEELAESFSSGKLSGEQIVALKAGEQQLAVEMARIEQARDQTAMEDRKSAREMQISGHSPVPAILSYLVTVGYFGTLAGMMTKWLVVADSQVALMMLGSLTTAWGSVLAFWFGTTRESARRTDLLAQSAPVKK